MRTWSYHRLFGYFPEGTIEDSTGQFEATANRENSQTNRRWISHPVEPKWTEMVAPLGGTTIGTSPGEDGRCSRQAPGICHGFLQAG
jgi:hypothetical protein